ncbi:hypothetical protein KM540_gp143 [Western grey kangaroopox virus]|uniref:Uncharacterized protein n=1 Tax=Western grey kangaroopox virus TaxID=1566307 RepID=A0A2C9DSU1_9POXV|nr:hypothetical protein KM540_gp143 [Western grey kangaroopox virus]ATI21074.1 hypothetical protein [Western grey kangaroopox virus]
MSNAVAESVSEDDAGASASGSEAVSSGAYAEVGDPPALTTEVTCLQQCAVQYEYRPAMPGETGPPPCAIYAPAPGPGPIPATGPVPMLGVQFPMSNVRMHHVPQVSVGYYNPAPQTYPMMAPPAYPVSAPAPPPQTYVDEHSIDWVSMLNVTMQKAYKCSDYFPNIEIRMVCGRFCCTIIYDKVKFVSKLQETVKKAKNEVCMLLLNYLRSVPNPSSSEVPCTQEEVQWYHSVINCKNEQKHREVIIRNGIDSSKLSLPPQSPGAQPCPPPGAQPCPPPGAQPCPPPGACSPIRSPLQIPYLPGGYLGGASFIAPDRPAREYGQRPQGVNASSAYAGPRAPTTSAATRLPAPRFASSFQRGKSRHARGNLATSRSATNVHAQVPLTVHNQQVPPPGDTRAFPPLPPRKSGRPPATPGQTSCQPKYKAGSGKVRKSAD